MTGNDDFEFCDNCAKLSGKKYEYVRGIKKSLCVVCGCETLRWHTDDAKRQFQMWLDSLGDE